MLEIKPECLSATNEDLASMTVSFQNPAFDSFLFLGAPLFAKIVHASPTFGPSFSPIHMPSQPRSRSGTKTAATAPALRTSGPSLRRTPSATSRWRWLFDAGWNGEHRRCSIRLGVRRGKKSPFRLPTERCCTRDPPELF